MQLGHELRLVALLFESTDVRPVHAMRKIQGGNRDWHEPDRGEYWIQGLRTYFAKSGSQMIVTRVFMVVSLH
jgi:hypothetical protein